MRGMCKTQFTNYAVATPCADLLVLDQGWSIFSLTFFFLATGNYLKLKKKDSKHKTPQSNTSLGYGCLYTNTHAAVT